MKKLLRPALLPAAALGLGGIALVLRRMLYAVAVDHKGLLLSNHPLELALLVLTAVMAAVIFLGVRKLDGSVRYEDNFSASRLAGAGHLMAMLVILRTALLSTPAMSGYLGLLWKLLGYLAPVCLLLAGNVRRQGRQPFFLLYLIPSLFYVLHVVNHYQLWCSNPQLQDYVFTLFATLALAMVGYYNAAFAVGLGNRRMMLAAGLAAVYLCLAELAVSEEPLLYFGSMLWALTGLCNLEPVPVSTEDGE